MPRTVAQGIAWLIGFALALWLWPLGDNRVSAEPASPYATLEGDLYAGVEQVRSGRHIVGLKRVPALDAVARAHSEDMARRGYLSHDSPEGTNPLQRIQASGFAGFTMAAENIGQTSRPEPTREIVNGWLNSAVHRTNLYAPAFNATGVGVARTPNGTWIYTQVYVAIPSQR